MKAALSRITASRRGEIPALLKATAIRWDILLDIPATFACAHVGALSPFWGISPFAGAVSLHLWGAAPLIRDLSLLIRVLSCAHHADLDAVTSLKLSDTHDFPL